MRARRASGQLQRKRHGLRPAAGGAELFCRPGTQRDGFVAVAAFRDAGEIDNIAIQLNVDFPQRGVRLGVA
jgi:hypothetical protein